MNKFNRKCSACSLSTFKKCEVCKGPDQTCPVCSLSLACSPLIPEKIDKVKLFIIAENANSVEIKYNRPYVENKQKYTGSTLLKETLTKQLGFSYKDNICEQVIFSHAIKCDPRGKPIPIKALSICSNWLSKEIINTSSDTIILVTGKTGFRALFPNKKEYPGSYLRYRRKRDLTYMGRKVLVTFSPFTVEKHIMKLILNYKKQRSGILVANEITFWSPFITRSVPWCWIQDMKLLKEWLT
jgi:Uracil DNA glycosylase superfamily